MEENRLIPIDNLTASISETFGLNNSLPGEEAADSEITLAELALLDSAGEDPQELTNLNAANLDNTDKDGELLNEVSAAINLSGNDLDVPGSEADDADEMIGEEDEENNSYSLGADKKD